MIQNSGIIFFNTLAFVEYAFLLSNKQAGELRGEYKFFAVMLRRYTAWGMLRPAKEKTKRFIIIPITRDQSIRHTSVLP